MRSIPHAAVKRIIKESDPNMRISKKGVEEATVALEVYGKVIAKAAIKYAVHAGRSTVKAEDIELATKLVSMKLEQ